MQQCILPRAIFSDMDAIYCARFIELLHIQMTTHFPTLSLLDRVRIDFYHQDNYFQFFREYTPFVVGLSENEANCFGRFTFLLLEMVMRWHSDKAIYDKECLCFPGFLINDKSLNDCQFTYDRYRSICHLWHVRITKVINLDLKTTFLKWHFCEDLHLS
jgi:THO complex subunit 2